MFGAAHHTRSGDLVPDCQPVQVAELAKTEFAMTVDIVRLLPADEHDLLEYYVEGTCLPNDVDTLYDALEVPNNATPPRLAIAVAQILLHHIQAGLPQRASVRGDKVFLNRKEHRRHKEARLAFNPQLVCTINWADSVRALAGLNLITSHICRASTNSWSRRAEMGLMRGDALIMP